MRKVNLRMNEQEKFEVIKNLVDHDGSKNRAALKLGISVRQVNRLIHVYHDKGKAGFVHGNRNRQPVNSISPELTDKILNLYEKKYQGFNYAHFRDMLEKDEHITVSYSTVYRILTSNGIYTELEHRATKKKRAKAKVLEKNPDITEEDIPEAVSHELALEDAHPRKARAKYFGEEVQMDASIDWWFGIIRSALHLAIDNATGRILGGRFELQETLLGYYYVFRNILLKYGIPHSFLTDNRTVFFYEKSSRKDDEKDVLTQFGYACKKLGIGLRTTSISQAKGQIERANQTFQRRLINELRLNNITDIDEANRYLNDVFIPDFNSRFALDPDKFESVMEKAPDENEINLTLAVLAPRKFNNGSVIAYKGKKYQAYDEEGNLVGFKKKTECLVITAFDGGMYVTVDDKVYALREFEENASYSENFDAEEEKPKKRKPHIPPMTHPWKRSSFLQHQNRAHSQHIYA